MKGITPVVATILLLMVAITIIGVAFIFFSRMIQTESSAGEQQLAEFLKSLQINESVGTSISMLPDTISKTGLFITAYGESSAHNKTFIANNFDIVIESLGMEKQIHGNNSNAIVLLYKDMSLQDTKSYYFDDWNVINKQEDLFLHSTDPAGMSFVPGNTNMTIYWQPDRRNTFPKSEDNSFNLSGYNIYSNKTGSWMKLNTYLIAATTYTDTGLATGTTYYYKVKSVDKEGNEYDFSKMISTATSNIGTQLILANATVIAWTDTINGYNTTFNFSVLAFGNPTSVILYINLYNTTKFKFDDTGETLSMTPQGNNFYNYSLTFHLPEKYKPNASHSYKPGFMFNIQASKAGQSTSARLPASGNYMTNINNRIKQPAYGAFVLDNNNIVWKTHYLNYIKDKLIGGYDGLYIDSAITGTYFTSGSSSDALPENFNKDIFRNATRNFIAFMKEGLDNAPLTYNGLIDAESGYVNITKDFLEVSDAALDEAFVYSSWQQPHYYDENVWRTRVNNSMNVDNMSKGVFLVSHGDKNDTRGRMFAFASYLIVKGRKSYFYFAGNGSYLETSYFPEWRIDLGSPEQPLKSNIDDYKVADGIYKREYKKGIVYVNAGDNEISINPGYGYRLVNVTGGLVPELGGDGMLRYDTIASPYTFTLGAHSGAIILKP